METSPTSIDTKLADSKKIKKPPRRREGIVGPLFLWELVRLARRGQDARARFILAASLLVILTLFIVFYFRDKATYDIFFGSSAVLSIDESARFAERFNLTFILAQLAILSLLTPAYAVGGIAEEKERKTLPFLLVSDLTNREILLGKFLGRLVFLLGIMFAGLPILALTLLYGGVSADMVFMSYYLTTTTVTLLAAIGAASAAIADTFRGALFRAYGLAALHVITGCGGHWLFSPFGVIAMLANVESDTNQAWMFYPAGLAYGGIQLIAAIIAVVLGMKWLRQLRSKSSIKDLEMRSKRSASSTPIKQAEKNGVPPHDKPLDEKRSVEPALSSSLASIFTSPTETEKKIAAGAAVLAAPSISETNGKTPSQTTVPVARKLPRPDVPPTRRLPVRELQVRPVVSDDDPFFWKETYITGSKQTTDDESIRSVVIAIGICVGLMVGIMVLVGIGGMLTGGSTSAPWLLIGAGCAALFAHSIVAGSSAAGTIVKERQRLTLESLLAIPVDRESILFPRWKVAITRGWWLGACAAIFIPLGFVSPNISKFVIISMVFYVLACPPLVVSVGLWLSIRCATNTRAVMWLLCLIGGLALYPILFFGAFRGESLTLVIAVSSAVTAVGAGSAWYFWRQSVRLFENDGR